MFMRVLISAAIVCAGCHEHRVTDTFGPSSIDRIPHPEGAVPRTPTLVLTDAGTLRFIEPLECPTEEIVKRVSKTEHATLPNLATFVVGLIATSVGGVLTISGVSDHDPSNVLTYAGVAAMAGGLPLAIGPWIGNSTTIVVDEPPEPEKRPGPGEPCGDRPLAAKFATLTVRGVEIHGKVGSDGTFAVSPYDLIDAFDPKMIPAWDISAIVETPNGPRTIQVIIDGGALATRAPAFLATASFVTKTEPMRLVPGIVPGTLRASLTSTADGPALRIVLPIKNDGPGDAWALRGSVTSSTKSVDGRILYIGHLPNGATSSQELLVPLGKTAAEMLRGATFDLSVELRDAHGTAPTTPIRFRGTLLGDAPR